MAKNVTIGGVDFTPDEVLKMVKAGALGVVQKNDPASTTPTRNVLHGQVQDGSGNYYGAFSSPGVRPQMFSTIARPPSFLTAGIVPFVKSESENEITEILTGQAAAAVTNAAGFCGNPPSPGNLKVCQQVYRFGNFYGKTELNAAALIGSTRNRADVSREIVNAAASDSPFIPQDATRIPDTRSVLRTQLFRFGVEVERATAQVAMMGLAGVQDNTYYGWFKQFAGLDAQIKTGYADAETNVACAAADSIVRSYGALVTGNSVNGYGIVEEMEGLIQALQQRAQAFGIEAAWALVMRRELFDVLVEVYACAYYLYACAGNTNAPNNRDAVGQRNLLDQMRSGRFLRVSGVDYPVIFDEGITQYNMGTDRWRSSIYITPIGNFGGINLTEFQYFDMANRYITEFMNAFGLETVSSDSNGMYLVGHRNTALCLEWHFQMRGRLILNAPFLAARLDNVEYVNSRAYRTAYPGASTYANGGVSLRQ